MTDKSEDTPPSAPARDVRTRRLARNTAVQSAATFGILVIGLVVTPVALRHLGLIEFGIWGYVSTVISYLTIIDPGFGVIITRYAARAHTTKERTEVRQITTFAILAWFAFLALLSPVMLVLLPILVHHLHLGSSEQQVAMDVFVWGYLFFFLSLWLGSINRILVGIGELWLSSIIDVTSRVAYGMLAVALLVDGFGIWALIIASTVQTALSLIATWIALRRHFGRVLGNPLRIERSVLRDLLRSGGWYQIASLLGALNSDTDPLVIGTFVGPRDVGIYNVATRLAYQVNYLPSVLQNALLPAVAASHPDEADHERILRTTVINGNRLTSLLSFSVAGGLVGLSPVIYRAWLGHLYSGVDTATAILVVGCLAATVGATVGTVLLATGQISLVAKITAAGVVANVALTVALVIPFGMTGVLIGTVAANATVALVSILLLDGQLNISFRESVWTWLWRLIVGSGVAGGTCGFILVVLPGSWQAGRAQAFGVLCLLGALYAVMLLIGLRITRFFHDDDISLLGRALPRTFGRLVAWQPILWLAGARR